jgi:glycosyltransferase involved in cell wall biosynthesis
MVSKKIPDGAPQEFKMPKKKRLLFVIDNVSYGGGEKVFSMLIRGLRSDRFEIFCASLPRGRFYEDVRGRCRFLSLDLTNRFDFRNISRLKSMMLEHGIDIVHSQGARADFYCAFAAAAGGAKVVSTVAMPVEGFDVCFLRKRLYALLNSLAEKKISRFITVSKRLETALVSGHHIPALKVSLIPNPVDLAEFDPENFDAGPIIEKFSLRGRLVLGAVGRLEWQKGYPCLIEALALMLEKEPGLREKLACLVAGAGRLDSDLKKMAEAAGLSRNMLFCGEILSVRDFLGALDIFLMPSLLEGQPLALLEAMAMGKAIVASDIPGINETAAAGQEAVLVPPSDPPRLSEALLNLIQDRQAALSLGRNARIKAEKFSLLEFIERHEAVYSGMSVPGAD